jgi:hypothetical protein
MIDYRSCNIVGLNPAYLLFTLVVVCIDVKLREQINEAHVKRVIFQ